MIKISSHISHDLNNRSDRILGNKKTPSSSPVTVVVGSSFDFMYPRNESNVGNISLKEGVRCEKEYKDKLGLGCGYH